MRLVTFHYANSLRTGMVFTRDGLEYVADLNFIDPLLPADMISFLQMGEDGLEQAKKAQKNADQSACHLLKDVRLAPPVPNPSKIICLGLNYQDHAPKGDQQAKQYPTFFAKFANTLVGHENDIFLPGLSDQIDYEAEMAVVVGKRCKNVTVDQALGVVAGYTIFNDVSARDYQSRTSQWLQGKSFDTFGPMGPVLVTSEEISDPNNLEICLFLNGHCMQSSNTCYQIFSVPETIAYLSQIMTLEVGDIISTGTPAGVGVLRDPPVFLKPGDRIEVHLEGVGVLANSVTSSRY